MPYLRLDGVPATQEQVEVSLKQEDMNRWLILVDTREKAAKLGDSILLDLIDLHLEESAKWGRFGTA